MADRRANEVRRNSAERRKRQRSLTDLVVDAGYGQENVMALVKVLQSDSGK